MRRQRTDGQETRQRLLTAAAEVFAEKGFWECTNTNICEKAGANTAAVNYHFGSKDNLYVEAWKYSLQRSLEKYPPDGGVPAQASAKERLYGRVLSFVRRASDPKAYEFEIIHKEMANPTGLLAKCIMKNMDPIADSIMSILDELLGDMLSEREVGLCLMSILTQCFGPAMHLRIGRSGHRVMPCPKELPIDISSEEIADHIIRFSMVGIEGLRKRKS